MTLHKLPSTGGLLVRKGTATPLGLRKAAAKDLDPEPTLEAGEGRASIREPVQLALVAGSEAETPSDSLGEPPPPASLLPFALHRPRPADGEVWELVTPDLLVRVDQAADSAKATAALEDSEAPPPKPAIGAQPASKLLFPDDSGALRIQPSRLTIRIPDAVPIHAPDMPCGPARQSGEPADPQTTAPKSPTEAWTVLLPAEDNSADTETAGAETAGAEAASTEAAQAPVAEPSWRIGVDSLQETRRTEMGRWLGIGAAVCLLIGGLAWWSFQSQAPEPQDATETRAAPDSPAAAQSTESTAGDTAVSDTAAETVESTPSPAQKSAVPDSGASEASGAAPQAPSVDLVRIEANGDAVIAGRAAPHSELIVLDNGNPIGTVQADAFGEWVFIPEVPLTQGGHEVGLVLKSVQGKVSVPAEARPVGAAPSSSDTLPASELPAQGNTAVPAPLDAAPKDSTPLDPASPEAAAPETEGGAQVPLKESGVLAPVPPRKPSSLPGSGGQAAPIPERKPVLADAGAAESAAGGAASADFEVQLASVKTRDGAHREWQKLQSRFPEVLGGMALNLHETKLSQRGTVIRIRTGHFQAQGDAVRFCARFRAAAQQECLVVRTRAGN